MTQKAVNVTNQTIDNDIVRLFICQMLFSVLKTDIHYVLLTVDLCTDIFGAALQNGMKGSVLEQKILSAVNRAFDRFVAETRMIFFIEFIRFFN